jgi:hypothetical protein
MNPDVGSEKINMGSSRLLLWQERNLSLKKHSAARV